MDDRIYLEYSAKLNDKKLGLEKKSVDYLLKFLRENGKLMTAEKLKTKGNNLEDIHWAHYGNYLVNNTTNYTGLNVPYVPENTRLTQELIICRVAVKYINVKITI